MTNTNDIISTGNDRHIINASCINAMTFNISQRPEDCIFGELALQKSNEVCWSGITRTSSSSHRL